MTKRFKNKVAVITGAAQGIGHGVALRMAKEGAQLVLVDRSLDADDRAPHDFLGGPAAFPVAPWRVAAVLRRPVFFMAGLYLGAKLYLLVFEPLADFSHTERGTRDAAMNSAMQAYADRLGDFCRRAPYNWFNFFDFWQRT